MRGNIVGSSIALALGVLTALAVSGAFAHTDGCHAAHTCPSDHHTYVWFDAAGQGWDCAAPDAPEYNPAVDTTPISQGGLTWYCHAAGAPPPPVATTTTATTNTTTTTTTTTTTPTEPECVYRDHRDLPDSFCTPGAVFRTATVRRICRPGYTKRVRDVSESVKERVFARYGITQPAPDRYEVDHLVALELGGSNSIKNLWPQPRSTANGHGFRVKDRLENRLHTLVCSRRMTLLAAQRAIRTNWVRAFKRFARR